MIESGAVVTVGKIRKATSRDELVAAENIYQEPHSPEIMLKDDIYKEFKLRGYNYR